MLCKWVEKYEENVVRFFIGGIGYCDCGGWVIGCCCFVLFFWCDWWGEES